MENIMTLSSAETYLIRDAVKGFHIQLQSSEPLPLLDFAHFLKEGKLGSLLQQKKRVTITEFLLNISNLGRDKRSVIIKELDSELTKVIELHMGHIENHKKQLESICEKLEDAFCDGFRNLFEVHLSQNQYLDMETVHNFLQTQKEEVIKRFDNHWKPGDSDFHQSRKAALKGKLDIIRDEIKKTQRQFLENERNSFSKLKYGVLEKLGQLQKYMRSVKLENILIRLLEDEIGKIEQFIDEQGVFGLEKFRKVHETLLEKIKAATIGLYVTEETMLPEIARSLVRNLDVQLRSCFQDQSEEEFAGQDQQAPAESNPNKTVVPVIDLENEPPRKRLRIPVLRLEKFPFPEPVAGTSRAVHVDVGDIQIIENNNEAVPTGQQKEPRKTNNVKVYKVFMDSKKAMSRAEKRRILLEEDEEAYIPSEDPNNSSGSAGDSNASSSAGCNSNSLIHAMGRKRSCMWTPEETREKLKFTHAMYALLNDVALECAGIHIAMFDADFFKWRDIYFQYFYDCMKLPEPKFINVMQYRLYLEEDSPVSVESRICILCRSRRTNFGSSTAMVEHYRATHAIVSIWTCCGACPKSQQKNQRFSCAGDWSNHWRQHVGNRTLGKPAQYKLIKYQCDQYKEVLSVYAKMQLKRSGLRVFYRSIPASATFGKLPDGVFNLAANKKEIILPTAIEVKDGESSTRPLMETEKPSNWFPEMPAVGKLAMDWTMGDEWTESDSEEVRQPQKKRQKTKR